ncbi:MAG: serine hydrolase [Armatimonadia bacterium]|nr:serine hydrolase [Armatimonadia bacterium]
MLPAKGVCQRSATHPMLCEKEMPPLVQAIRRPLLLCGIYSMLIAAPSLVDGPVEAQVLKQEFQAEVDALHSEYDFPGATAAYALPGGETEVVATGFADVEHQIRMTPEARMLAASIGKTFVAATALSLVREGTLSLDAPISQWLGEREWFSRLPNHDTITLRQLLNHTSGIPNHVESRAFTEAFAEGWRSYSNPFTPRRLIEFVLDRPALFEPGHGWTYSDTGYILVGLIIEASTGQSYYDEVRRRFLDPLHLDLTSPSDRFELSGLATGYMTPENALGLPSRTTTRPGVLVWHPGVEWTGGGLVSNSQDLVVWAKALFEGKAMDGPYTEALLNAVPIDSNAPDIQYGLGVGIHRTGPAGPTYGHGGWIPGYTSSLRYYPDHRIAVAFQINTDIGIVDDSTPVVEEMETRLARLVLEALKR